MSQSTIKIEGFDRLQKKMEMLTGTGLQRQLERAMDVSMRLVRTTARDLVPVDTGALRRSIQYNVVSSLRSGVKGEIGPREPYGADVEFGTKPHKVSAVALSSWAKKKGLNPYAIAKGIERKGTKAHPFMYPAVDRSIEAVKDIFSKVIDYILSL